MVYSLAANPSAMLGEGVCRFKGLLQNPGSMTLDARRYCRMQVTCESEGLCRVGWATRAASYEIGKDRRSFGYGSTGKKSHGGSFEDYGTPFGKVIIASCTFHT